MTAPVLVAVLAFAFSASLLVDRKASVWTIVAMASSALLLAVSLRLLKQILWGWDLLLVGAVTLSICGVGAAIAERRGARVVAALLIAFFGLFFVNQRYNFI
ncbi:MAG: hypothetical protein JJ863_33880 [Deltaproteobacteria bacterium]|nr:hypothetical protein [Deltaproteobacteria bacterium]